MLDTDDIKIYLSDIFEIYNSDRFTNEQKFKSLLKLLKQFYKKQAEGEARYFSSSLALTLFINDKYNLPTNLRLNLNEINKFNKEIKNNPNIKISSDDLKFILKNIYLIISNISNYDLEDENSQFIKSIPKLKLQSKSNKIKDYVDIYNAIVVENPFFDKKIDAKYIELKCLSEEFGNFILKVGYPYLEKANKIYQGMSFNILFAEIIREEPFTVSIRSDGLFIFEPDFLIDATSLAESFGIDEGYRIYFLKKYFSTSSNIAILSGKIINTFFDEIILNPNITFEEAKKIAYKENSLPIYALSKNKRNEIKSLSNELNFEFSNIKTQILNYIINEFEGAEFTVEPSFISPKYGIQGRIDLLAEYSSNPNKKDVIELKSGKPADTNYMHKVSDKTMVKFGVWKNHLAQVLCYNLLLESAYKDRTGNSLIFYIKAGENPTRDVASYHYINQQIILLRNDIILLENTIMSNSFKFFDYLSDLTDLNLPYFIRDKIAQFINIYNRSNELEKEYLKEFTAFTLRERYAAKNGLNLDNNQNGFAALWRNSIDEKLEDNSILLNLKIRKEDSNFESLYISFDYETGNIFTSFRRGDIVVLYSYYDRDEIDITKDQLLRGVIKEINTNSIVLSLRNKLVSRKLFDENLLWAIEPDRIDSTERNIFSSLLGLISAPKERKEAIFGLSKENIKSDYNCKIDKLNLNQHEIIQNAINSSDYYLIDGPPGTGKTHKILKNIIKILHQDFDKNILVTAYTNRAVDEISEAIKMISPEIEFVRIGSKEASDDYEHHLPKIIDYYGHNEAYKRIKYSRVIISTVSSLHTNSEIFELKEFDTLIVDEASQILETYLIGLIIKVRKFILIGDDKQLPPISIQNQSSLLCTNPVLQAIGINNFSNSLFLRLKQICETKGWDFAIGKLTHQARMHIDIQDFPNAYFYNNRLVAMKESQLGDIVNFDINSEYKIEQMLAKSRVIFIDCPIGLGKISENESEMSKQIIDVITNKYDLDSELIGVISPFRMQCFEISKKLDEKQKHFINIDTVERYQGSQRKFIIMSCAASNENLLEKMMSQDDSGKVDRKLNVAITRAKSHFIMLGNSSILSKSTHYRNFIEYTKSQNSYYKMSELI